jgi:hypothetical protein
MSDSTANLTNMNQLLFLCSFTTTAVQFLFSNLSVPSGLQALQRVDVQAANKDLPVNLLN